MNCRRVFAILSLIAAAGALGSFACGQAPPSSEFKGQPPFGDAGPFDAPPAPSDGPLLLAMPDGEVSWVGVLADRVYFSLYAESIDTVPSAGGAGASVVSPASASAGFYISSGFAFDSMYVYWSSGYGAGGTINRAPLAGGSSQVLASSPGFIAGIALDSGNVYWVAQDQGEILTVPVTGGTAATVASGLTTPAGIAIHGGTVYLTDADGDLLSVPTRGGPVKTLVHGPGLSGKFTVADFPLGIAVDDNNVYFSQYYAAKPTILKVPLKGGAPIILANASAAGIAVDAKNVYWVTGGGDVSTVNEVPIAGGAVRVLATNQSLAVGPALDEYSVYWGTSAFTATCGVCPPGPTGSNAVMKVGK